ncbi:hypothetical protein LCGC14_0434720 [marine sediment metagenome]|uniref:Uncharacterized protein n=1 Tax=marine sediment metagenome TaxID=412755 RepID=A0A0F9SLY3_9ZZZZ
MSKNLRNRKVVGEETHYQCSKCKEYKPITDFFKSKILIDGIRYWCKKCDMKIMTKTKDNPNTAKYMRTYWKKKRKKEPWYAYWDSSKRRCIDKSSKYFKKGIKHYLTVDQARKLWERDKAFLLKRPSIHRINNKGDYTFENCAFIELSENSRLGRKG